MAGSNISMHCIHPGGIKTNITNSAKISSVHVYKSQILADFNKQTKTTAEQAANIILKGINKNKHRILVGGYAKLLDCIVRCFLGNDEKILGFEKGVINKRKIDNETTQ